MKLAFDSLPTGVSAPGRNSETTVNIIDNDVTVSYELASYNVTEGGSNVTVKVILSADPEHTVTIPINTTNQNGADDDDYSVMPTSLTFNSGDTEKSITFSATDDSDDDDNESVKLTFGNLPPRVSAGTNSEATVNIIDNDVTVSYELASYNVTEGGSNVTVKVILSADPEHTVIIPSSYRSTRPTRTAQTTT